MGFLTPTASEGEVFALEHNTKVYMLFVYLRKAYSSVPREGLWLKLQKYGMLLWGLRSYSPCTLK